MNKTDAIWAELYNAAKAVLKPRGVSSIIEAGRHAGRFDAGVVDIKRVNKTEKGIKKKLNFKSFPEARGRKEPRAAFLYAINVIQSIYGCHHNTVGGLVLFQRAAYPLIT